MSVDTPVENKVPSNITVGNTITHDAPSNAMTTTVSPPTTTTANTTTIGANTSTKVLQRRWICDACKVKWYIRTAG